MSEQTARKYPWLATAPGVLYACGSFGEKGQHCLPLTEPSKAVDKAGHCIYPAKVSVASTSHHHNKKNSKLQTATATTKFLFFSADTNVYAAIDENYNLWVWGVGRSPFSNEGTVLMEDCVVSCDVGNNFVAAVTADGRALLFGNFKGLGGCSDAGCGQATNVELSPSVSASASTRKADKDTADAHVVVAAVQVAACNNTVIFLGADGVMYTAGDSLNNAQQPHAPSAASHSATTNVKFRAVSVGSDGEPLPPMKFVALGSRHGAAIAASGTELYVWGDGLSGALGLGDRTCHQAPALVPDFNLNGKGTEFLHVSCTRGQADSKRFASAARKSNNSPVVAGGQEGQRTHAVTSDGRLWIAGTTHKGMGADHLNKTMAPDNDLLHFYRVGGGAADSKAASIVPTGAAEDIVRCSAQGASSNNATATTAATTPSREVVAMRMGMKDVIEFGKGGNTGYLSGVRVTASQPVHIHSLALAENGQVFAWGCGSDGRTGLRAFMRGPGGSKRAMKCYVSTPSQVEALEGRNVVFATAGKYWSFFLVA